jgi:hypothetical protein
MMKNSTERPAQKAAGAGRAGKDFAVNRKIILDGVTVV